MLQLNSLGRRVGPTAYISVRRFETMLADVNRDTYTM